MECGPPPGEVWTSSVLLEVIDGDSDEDELYCQRSQLYVLRDGQWKERGLGDARLLQRRSSGRVRFLMRRAETRTVLANHYVVGMPCSHREETCSLTSCLRLGAGGDECWCWRAPDCAEGSLVTEQLALRFGSAELASRFGHAWDAAKRANAERAGIVGETAEGRSGGEAAGGSDAEEDDADEELFELCGASTVYLRGRRRVEEELLAATGQEAAPLAGNDRLALGRLLACAIAWIWSDHDPLRAGSQRIWLDGVQMLDALTARGVPISRWSTAYAMAVLRLLWKAGESAREIRSESLAGVANAAAAAVGLNVVAATAEDIDAAEEHVLHALGWRVAVPSVHWWLSAFCSRFHELARRDFPGGHDLGPTVAWVLKRGCLDGAAVVTQWAATGRLTPRTLSMGLLGLALASVRMVPLQDLCPEALSADEWEQTYFEAMGTPLPCVQPGGAGATGRLLERATACGMAEIREACGRVAAAVVAASAPGRP